ncbi:MAG TPA: hypothetical protein VGD30_05710 [Telluria sp.]
MKLFVAFLLASGSVMAADDAPFFRCRDISDDSKRLACYDAVQRPTPAQVRQVQEKTFGLAAKGEQLEAIESHIPGSFDGWEANQKITLANGQVWQVTDDSTGVVIGNNLKAKVARGALGAMYLEIDRSRKAPRVKRVK